MIVIIDYKVGNLLSVQNMLRKAGEQDILISGSPDDIQKADKLILPGVGAFDYGMAQLKESQLQEVLNQKVLVEKTPILGICLGAQLLTEFSEEGNVDGLGWIKGETKKFRKEQFDNPILRIPHMGWNDLKINDSQNPLFKGLEQSRFYFVHSYHIVCKNEDNSLATSHYGYDFTAAVHKENIFGVQFHPEKSHRFGLELLKNFRKL